MTVSDREWASDSESWFLILSDVRSHWSRDWVALCLLCACCFIVYWCFVDISCKLGFSPNQYPEAHALLFFFFFFFNIWECSTTKTEGHNVSGLVENASTAIHLSIHLTPVSAYEEDRWDRTDVTGWKVPLTLCLRARHYTYALYNNTVTLTKSLLFAPVHTTKLGVSSLICYDYSIFLLVICKIGRTDQCRLVYNYAFCCCTL